MVVSPFAVVAVELSGGLQLSVAWDGGPFAELRVVRDGVCGPVLEVWSMVDELTGEPAIETTPCALANLVRFRAQDHRVVAQWARAATPHDATLGARSHAAHAPAFSDN